MYLLKSHGKVKIIYIGKLSLHSLFSQANRMQIADMNYDTCSVPSAQKKIGHSSTTIWQMPVRKIKYIS